MIPCTSLEPALPTQETAMKRILLLSLFVSTGTTTSAAAFELRQGDRVVLLGNTLVEREQRHGYWETALTTRFPDRDVTFRNLGWSGDTVFGEARAGFGSPADGFRLLTEHVLALKPTVLLIAYGINEAFEGEAGLLHRAVCLFFNSEKMVGGHFERGLQALKALSETAPLAAAQAR